jgi:multidrug resistance protein MdtO
VSEGPFRPPVLPGALGLFVGELVASPRRWRAALRLSAGATLATAFVVAFHVPHGEYLVVILFLVGANDGYGSTRRAAFRVGAFVLGSVLCIGALAALSDKPWILYPFQAVLLGVVIFTSRTTTVPYAPVLVAVCFLLTVPEFVSSPEASMDAAVWSLAMIGLGVVGGTVLQLVLWRETPQDLLLANFAGRFALVEEVLSNALQAQPGAVHHGVHGLVAATSIARQLQLLEDGEDESPFLRQRHTEQLKLITDVQLLVRGALEVEQAFGDEARSHALPPELRARMLRLLACARTLRKALHDRRLEEVVLEPPAAMKTPPPASSGDLEHAVQQMEDALVAMPDRLGFLAGVRQRAAEAPTDVVAARPIFTAAFRLDNVEEIRVALKAALAIGVCGLLYEILVWPGIAACVFAILLLAQGSVGASLERAIVQICGVLLGATWAFVVVVVAMPNMSSLASLLVMLFPLYFAVSWLAFGGGVTTAASLQMAMAAILVLLPEFGPSTNLIPARDRVIGILLGNVVFATINLSLWPVYAGTPSRFAHLIRDIAQLVRCIAHGNHAGARSQAFGIHRSLAQALALQDQARFEPLAPLVRGTLLHLTASLQDVFQQALDTGRLEWSAQVEALPPAVRASITALDVAVAMQLDALADSLEHGVLEATSSPKDVLAAVRTASAVQAPGSQGADVEAYLVVSGRLLEAVRGLADILRRYTGLLAAAAHGSRLPSPQAG